MAVESNNVVELRSIATVDNNKFYECSGNNLVQVQGGADGTSIRDNWIYKDEATLVEQP